MRSFKGMLFTYLINRTKKLDNQIGKYTVCLEVLLENVMTTACSQGRLIIPGSKPVMQKTCVTDAMRLLNTASKEVTSALSLSIAKKATKTFVKTLPT